MTKKTSLPPISTRHVFRFGLKLAISLSISLCVFALLRIQYDSQSELYSSSSVHRRSRVSSIGFEGPPKIAFLFLARRDLPIDFLWGSFFENADVANFSVYVHSEPGFVFDESTTRSAFFYNRELPNSIQVGWGEASMIQAERLLLEAALEDPANQRFVLLSDSCVPLYNFSYIYSYLMASPRSFVDSFLDKKEGRYNPKMSPVIPKNKWRKGSQWISLVRSHAEVVVDDEVIFPMFKKLCKRRPLMDASKGKQNIKLQKQHNCIPDEHYVQTLIAMSDLEGELERRTVTYTLWNQSTTNMERKGWHPITFSYSNAGHQQIKRIKDINHVYYETEFRTEWCSNNSTFVPCFLFARKFSRGAAMRLLSDGVVGPFDASALLATPP
ncbi:DNA polymerase epsilon subunit B like [Actinidia chinensis var. chinensis]|uniref:DNA polymerase epsilon subunit B like n=1 Tax=Actinidia chinensis var. chinensis TaxID=1590841 RepID=A0A2R6Q9W2_ACTCC|nr:DNA polymerase epsilon subunit B like [Actinidia chinensis var. chinensis]